MPQTVSHPPSYGDFYYKPRDGPSFRFPSQAPAQTLQLRPRSDGRATLRDPAGMTSRSVTMLTPARQSPPTQRPSTSGQPSHRSVSGVSTGHARGDVSNSGARVSSSRCLTPCQHIPDFAPVADTCPLSAHLTLISSAHRGLHTPPDSVSTPDIRTSHHLTSLHTAAPSGPSEADSRHGRVAFTAYRAGVGSSGSSTDVDRASHTS